MIGRLRRRLAHRWRVAPYYPDGERAIPGLLYWRYGRAVDEAMIQNRLQASKEPDPARRLRWRVTPETLGAQSDS